MRAAAALPSALLALLAARAEALAPALGARAQLAPPRAAATPTMLANRWNEPILDDSLPDPVYDDKTPYKGRVPYGFSSTAETLNGRAAMLGFTILFLQELIVGKGVLEQYGLPYDVGAQLQQGETGMPTLVGLAIAVVITVGGSGLGFVLGKKN